MLNCENGAGTLALVSIQRAVLANSEIYSCPAQYKIGGIYFSLTAH